jgi:hypothetical protein
MKDISITLVSLLFLWSNVSAIAYNEDLLIEPLPNANVLLHFQFKLGWEKKLANKNRILDF